VWRHGSAVGRVATSVVALGVAALSVGLIAPAATAAGPVPPVGGAGLAGSGVLVDRTSGVPAPPTLAAGSYVLADLDTGAVLVAKAPHAPHLPASTLKVLTALTVMRRLDPAAVVTAEPDDVVDGSLVGMVPGLTYTVHQLLQGMMLSSGNDAATALARVAGGPEGVAGTVAAMQQTAHDLGARDTVVRDPSGLDAAGQVTSAYDLALIAREALRDPHFEALVTTRRAKFPGKVAKPKPGATTATPPRRASFEIGNHNTLLFNYDGAIGVKNGYTVAARWTIVGAAERDGHRYVVTALRRTDRSWRPTAALLDWAFRYGGRVQPVGRLVSAGELDREPASSEQAPATALAAGSTAATATGQSAPRRWVGGAGLAGAIALLALMALRARRLRLVATRGRVSDPARRTRPRVPRDGRS
jgi:serine-type D-Ala-D-Ala carboxypeptidase (penicillin-binding protein 5/6)